MSEDRKQAWFGVGLMILITIGLGLLLGGHV